MNVETRSDMADKYYTLDRFEGEWAILIPESGDDYIRVEKSLLFGVKEGDAVRESQGGWQVDSVKTAELRAAMAERWRVLKGKGRK